jgi:hypothetical protein
MHNRDCVPALGTGGDGLQALLPPTAGLQATFAPVVDLDLLQRKRERGEVRG